MNREAEPKWKLLQERIVLLAFAAIPMTSQANLAIATIYWAWHMLIFTDTFAVSVLQLGSGIAFIPVVLIIWRALSREKIGCNYVFTLLSFLFMVNFAIAVLSMILVIVTWERSYGDRFCFLMNSYHNDSGAKHMVDELQQVLSCCGGNNITDWFYKEWRHVSVEPLHSVDVYREGWDAVPYSCCSSVTVGVCIHEKLTTFGIDSLNLDACGPAIKLITVLYLTLCSLMAIWSAAPLGWLLNRIKGESNGTQPRDAKERQCFLDKKRRENLDLESNNGFEECYCENSPDEAKISDFRFSFETPRRRLKWFDEESAGEFTETLISSESSSTSLGPASSKGVRKSASVPSVTSLLLPWSRKR